MRAALLLVVALLAVQGSSAVPAFALYQLSMATTNQVLIWGGDSNGVLTPAAAVNTQGSGYAAGSGNVQSQHALTVAGGYVFAANPGSGTISQLRISTADPTVLTFVNSTSTGGDWPNAVGAYSKDGRDLVCVVNSGAVNNGLRCFTFSSTGMTVIPNGDRWFGLPLTTPPVSHTGPSQVSFLPDGSGIVVINKSPPTNDAPPYRLFAVDTTANVPSVHSANSSAIGAVNFAGAFDSDGTFVTVDAGNGVQMLTLSTTGGVPTLTTAASFFSLSPAVAPCWVERSPLTGHFYTGNAGSGSVTEFSRSGTTLTIVNQVPVGHSLTDVAVASLGGTQDFLFVNTGPSVNAFVLTASGFPASYQNVSTGADHPAGLAIAYYSQPSSATHGSVSSAVVALAALLTAFAAAQRAL